MPGVSGRGAALVTTVAGLVYPFAVLFAVRHEQSASLWVLAILAAILCVTRVMQVAPGESPGLRARLGRAAGPTLLLGLAIVGRRWHLPRLALFWPIIISLFLLAKFWRSLGAVPIVERFARLRDPDLSPAKVAHCRTVTKIWCWFFAANAAVTGALVLVGDVRLWTAYTGGLAYLLMGLLFAGEFVVRKVRFGASGDGVPDRIVARLITLWRAAFAR